jgi:hypothetical protein
MARWSAARQEAVTGMGKKRAYERQVKAAQKATEAERAEVEQATRKAQEAIKRHRGVTQN